MIINRRP